MPDRGRVARAAARLLLREMAAELGVEPTRQAHRGGGGANGLAKTRRRHEQRRAALRGTDVLVHRQCARSSPVHFQ
eukprot:3335480-Prymnesium_polylepis.1